MLYIYRHTPKVTDSTDFIERISSAPVDMDGQAS